MFPRRSTRVEIEFEILKEPHGKKIYSCDERSLTELIQKNWRGSNILVAGIPGIGKTLFCEKLAQELTNSQELNVHKYECVEELRNNGRRHFYSHENHELIILVDNVTSSQLDERVTENIPSVTTVLFSRTLSVENFDCAVTIKGSPNPSLWDNISSWNNHIGVLCSIPFLLVLFESSFNKNVPRHDIYFLLFATYVNYCQTSQVSLFSNVDEIPVKIKKLLKDLADVAYTCTSKGGSTFIDDHRLQKFGGVGVDELGVVTQTDDGRWEFTFEGSIDCLTAFKLFWISEEQFDKDTHPGNIKVPHEAMKLYKGV